VCQEIQHKTIAKWIFSYISEEQRRTVPITTTGDISTPTTESAVPNRTDYDEIQADTAVTRRVEETALRESIRTNTAIYDEIQAGTALEMSDVTSSATPYSRHCCPNVFCVLSWALISIGQGIYLVQSLPCTLSPVFANRKVFHQEG